ncbi:unnamed protein product [Sphenostylis stenocarpa]|uniref:Uncharacterized protein n=1 Tax=Sphenostylis stenocarpa TaxID=92480 RepID=A0AA86TC79_9FABA|nr:unnamed protein product [Sphenostylis stenocarpa]
MNETRYYLGNEWHDLKLGNNVQEGYQCDFQFVIDKAKVAKELLVRVRSNGSLHWVLQTIRNVLNYARNLPTFSYRFRIEVNATDLQPGSRINISDCQKPESA